MKRKRIVDERALQAVYDLIPDIPDCKGKCSFSCGPIGMFRGEWDRVTRSLGASPQVRPGSLTCPMLSPNGRCKVYSVRPYICRLWGTTPTLACPEGCTPERWLTSDEARDIFERIKVLTGPRVVTTMGPRILDLWRGIDMEGREARERMLQEARRHRARTSLQTALDGAEALIKEIQDGE